PERGGLEVQPGGERHVPRRAEARLRDGDGRRALLQDLVGEGLCLGQEAVRGDAAIHEPDPLRRPGVDPVPGVACLRGPARPGPENRCISKPERFAISLMSAPATKARSPAPVRMIAPTSAAIDRCSMAIDSSRKTVEFRAFRASGRFTVMIARRSSISVLMKP